MIDVYREKTIKLPSYVWFDVDSESELTEEKVYGVTEKCLS